VNFRVRVQLNPSLIDQNKNIIIFDQWSIFIENKNENIIKSHTQSALVSSSFATSQIHHKSKENVVVEN